MANFISKEKVSKIDLLVRAGYGLRYIAKKVVVAKHTAMTYRQEIIKDIRKLLCPCGKSQGHKGFCSFRLSYCDERVEYLRTSPFFGGRPKPIPRPKIDPLTEGWPFWCKDKDPLYPDMVLEVNKAVNQNIPEKIRADVCQDILLDILEGKILAKDIEKLSGQYIKKQYQLLQDRFRFVSINQKIPGYDMTIESRLRSNSFN